VNRIANKLFLVTAAIGFCGVIDNITDEMKRNPWMGLLVGSLSCMLIHYLYYIQPEDKTCRFCTHSSGGHGTL
jgi:uncharacterized membrane protein